MSLSFDLTNEEKIKVAYIMGVAVGNALRGKELDITGLLLSSFNNKETRDLASKEAQNAFYSVKDNLSRLTNAHDSRRSKRRSRAYDSIDIRTIVREEITKALNEIKPASSISAKLNEVGVSY